MREAVDRWFEAISSEERQDASKAFDRERTRWRFTPARRQGPSFGSMDTDGDSAAAGVLRSFMTEEGYRKALGVVSLEGILQQMEGGRAARDPGRYHFLVFGKPGAGTPWMFRFEGHHISINVTAVGDEVSATPMFFGANPATVPTGYRRSDWRLLGDEEDAGRHLLALLTDEQRSEAIVATEAPRDIISSNDSFLSGVDSAGLAYADMDAHQQAALNALVEVYLRKMQPELAARHRDLLHRHGGQRIRFAWAGSEVRGFGHYYRIWAPRLLIEYDNTQNGANHIHAVIRDPQGDFGEDLLRRHYRESHDR